MGLTWMMALSLLSAPPAPRDPSARAHDGFFFRATSAGGFGVSSSQDHESESLGDDAGSMVGAWLAGGHVVAPDLILHVDLMFRSTVSFDFDTFCDSQSECDPADEVTSHDLEALGGGLTLYFPRNYYVTGSALYGNVATQYRGVDARRRSGPGGAVAIGTEWWVGSNWGLGVALQGVGLWAEDNWQAMTFGVAFSATYN